MNFNKMIGHPVENGYMGFDPKTNSYKTFETESVYKEYIENVKEESTGVATMIPQVPLTGTLKKSNENGLLETPPKIPEEDNRVIPFTKEIKEFVNNVDTDIPYSYVSEDVSSVIGEIKTVVPVSNEIKSIIIEIAICTIKLDLLAKEEQTSVVKEKTAKIKKKWIELHKALNKHKATANPRLRTEILRLMKIANKEAKKDLLENEKDQKKHEKEVEDRKKKEENKLTEEGTAQSGYVLGRTPDQVDKIKEERRNKLKTAGAITAGTLIGGIPGAIAGYALKKGAEKFSNWKLNRDAKKEKIKEEIEHDKLKEKVRQSEEKRKAKEEVAAESFYNDLLEDAVCESYRVDPKRYASILEVVKENGVDGVHTFLENQVAIEDRIISNYDLLTEATDKFNQNGDIRYSNQIKGLQKTLDEDIALLEKSYNDSLEYDYLFEYVMFEAANMEDEIRPIVSKIENAGYGIKYASPGHKHLRKVPDRDRDGIYYDHLYSDARVVFDKKYPELEKKELKLWHWKDVDDRSYLDITPKKYDGSDSNVDKAFADWKAEYMDELKKFADSLGSKKNDEEVNESADDPDLMASKISSLEERLDKAKKNQAAYVKSNGKENPSLKNNIKSITAKIESLKKSKDKKEKEMEDKKDEVTKESVNEFVDQMMDLFNPSDDLSGNHRGFTDDDAFNLFNE